MLRNVCCEEIILWLRLLSLDCGAIFFGVVKDCVALYGSLVSGECVFFFPIFGFVTFVARVIVIVNTTT